MRRIDVEFEMSVKMSKIELTANRFKFQGVGVGPVRCEMRNIWLTLAAVNLVTTSSVSRRGLTWEEG